MKFFSYGCTALHYAVDNSQKELINFALECRANIEERDNNGWTPLLRGGTHYFFISKQIK